ncbi:efflux RND transporter periplasmic adaptor subunit [Psychrobium sp. 1_MG-2023]|nr:efflux RND transporter periplasmic adaptor subunit [Psychrobium sp. 1_MG-2023]
MDGSSNMWIKLGQLSVVIATLVGLSGCFEQEVVAREPIVPMVKIIDIDGLSQSSERQFPAQVEANNDSHLAFRVSGEVQKFLVKAGNRVEKGQILAQLDPRDYNISVADREARHALALSQFNRTKQLLERELASQSQFDEARASLLVAESNLNSAKTALEYTTLRAPYAGTIAKVFVEKHQNIQAQQVILNLQNFDRVDVSIHLSEKLVATIDKQTKYQPDVVFDSMPDERFKLTVKEWDAQADPVTRSYKVVFTMALPADKNILPGMSGTVFADLAQVTKQDFSHVVLPVAAVFSASEQPVNSPEKFVWRVAQDMTVSRIPVRVGQLTESGVIITDGLEGNELIVGAGVHHLRQGMKVRPWVRERGL